MASALTGQSRRQLLANASIASPRVPRSRALACDPRGALLLMLTGDMLPHPVPRSPCPRGRARSLRWGGEAGQRRAPEGAGGRRGSPATALYSFVGGRCPPEAAAMPEQLKTRCDVPTGAGGSVRQGRWPTVSEKMRVMIDGSAQRSIGERGICWGSRDGPSRSELCHCAMPHASCSGAHRK